MTLRTESARCPACGAPLPLAPGALAVICIYCNGSVQVTAAPAGAPPATPPTLTMQAIAPDVVEQVKQLVLTGKRDEAIALYAQHAKLDHAGAEKALNGLLLPLLASMTKRAPIHSVAILICLVLFSLFGLGAWWGAMHVTQSVAYVLLAVVCALLFALLMRAFIPKVYSSFIASFGTEGRGAILKRVILQPGFRPGGTLLAMVMRVEPAAGGAPFVDEEIVLIRDESVPKLEPGNVIRVRHDSAKDRRVFPTSPIEVVGNVKV